MMPRGLASAADRSIGIEVLLSFSSFFPVLLKRFPGRRHPKGWGGGGGTPLDHIIQIKGSQVYRTSIIIMKSWTRGAYGQHPTNFYNILDKSTLLISTASEILSRSHCLKPIVSKYSLQESCTLSYSHPPCCFAWTSKSTSRCFQFTLQTKILSYHCILYPPRYWFMDIFINNIMTASQQPSKHKSRLCFFDKKHPISGLLPFRTPHLLKFVVLSQEGKLGWLSIRVVCCRRFAIRLYYLSMLNFRSHASRAF